MTAFENSTNSSSVQNLIIRKGFPFFYHRTVEPVKSLTVPKKKLKGGTLWDFPTSILSQNSKKIEGGTLWGKFFFRKKVSQKLKGVPFVSPGTVCYAGKQEKPFWFSSLGQMVQFGAIKFCRTFKNYFGQFVWIENKKESHYNSRVSLHEAPTKKRVNVIVVLFY